jgi:hypothetical protein
MSLEGVAVRGWPEPGGGPLGASRPLLPGAWPAVLPKALHTLLGEQVLRLHVWWEHSASLPSEVS